MIILELLMQLLMNAFVILAIEVNLIILFAKFAMILGYFYKFLILIFIV